MSQEDLIPFQEEDEGSMGSKSIPPAGSAGNPAQGGEEGARDEPLGKGGSRVGEALRAVQLLGKLSGSSLGKDWK